MTYLFYFIGILVNNNKNDNNNKSLIQNNEPS